MKIPLLSLAGFSFASFCLLATPSARGMNYIVNENYNNAAIGGSPAGWSTTATGGTVTVQALPDANNRSVKIQKSGSANEATATRTFTAVNGVVTVEARVKSDETAGYKCALYIGNFVDVAFDGGNIKACVGSTLTTLMPFTAGTWYDLRVRLDTGAQTYSLFVDGIEAVHQGAFRNTSSSVSILMFSIGAGSTGTLYYDDVLVYTDTPATASYLVNENFENAAASAPAGWTLSAPSGSTVQVQAFPNAGNHSMLISKPASAGNASAARSFGATGGKVVVQANVLSHETAGYKCAFYVVTSAGVPVVSVAFDGGNIKSFVGSTLTALQAFDYDSWYTIKAVIDTSAGKYDLYVDGRKLLANAACRNAAGSVASVQFMIGDGSAGTLCFDNVLVLPFTTSKPTPIYDVANYGAVGDGTSMNTTAIQNAINACAGSGGTVYLHDGTFLSGTLQLGSNMTFYVENTATLLGSPNQSDYPPLAISGNSLDAAWDISCGLLTANNVSNVHIDGGGTIDGNGEQSSWESPSTTPDNRPAAVDLIHCTNASVRNVFITRSAQWDLVSLESSNLTLADVCIDSEWGYNRDGLDMCDAHNVVIERCNTYTGDDALCFKSSSTMGVDNVTLRYCNVGYSRDAGGLKFGTASYGGFTNVVAEDVYIKGVGDAAIGIDAVDGGTAYNLTFRRITANEVFVPIFAVIGTRGNTPSGEAHKMGMIDHIRYEAVSGSNFTSNIGCAISGTVASGITYPIYSLLFSNVDLDFPGGFQYQPPVPPEMDGQYPQAKMWGHLPAWAYFIRHLNGISFVNSNVTVGPNDLRSARVDVDVANSTTR